MRHRIHILLLALGQFVTLSAVHAVTVIEESDLRDMRSTLTLLQRETPSFDTTFLQLPTPFFLPERPKKPISLADVDQLTSKTETQMQTRAQDEAILEAICKLLAPDGFFQRDQEWILVFNSTVVGNGGSLKIKYAGAVYTLKITDITKNAFTAHLGKYSQKVEVKKKVN